LEDPKSLKVEDNAKNTIQSYFKSKSTLEEIRSFLIKGSYFNIYRKITYYGRV
jgi:hypothetical protein